MPTTIEQFGKTYKFGPAYGNWAGDSLVSSLGDIYTITPEGNLEIRGKGWGPTIRSRKRDPYDRVSICKFGSKERAKAIAEMTAILTSKTVQEDSKKFYETLTITRTP